MSQENVELVRRILDLVNRRAIDRALDATHEDFEADYSNSIGPTRGIYRGRQQVRELWRSFVEAWREVRWDPEEVIDVDETRVIAVNHVRMRGRGSGLEVDTRVAHVWTVSDGRAESVQLYQSKDEALEAVGLRE